MRKVKRDSAGEIFHINRFSIPADCLLSRVNKPYDCNVRNIYSYFSCCFISVSNFLSLPKRRRQFENILSQRAERHLNLRESNRMNSMKSLIIFIIKIIIRAIGPRRFTQNECVARIGSWEICTKIESEYRKNGELLGQESKRGRTIWKLIQCDDMEWILFRLWCVMYVTLLALYSCSTTESL